MVVFIPMICNGGMISSYVVNTQLLNLKNSIRKSVSKCAEAALADEPTGALDQKNGQMVMDLLLSLQKEGRL